MRTSTTRLALAAAALATVGFVSTASAAPKAAVLTFTDPAGDALATQKAFDVTKVTVTTKGVSKRGRYVPKTLVVSLTTSGELSTVPGSTYGVNAELSGCGYLNFSYTPGAALGEGGLFAECGSPADETGSTSTLYDAPPVVSGRTVTWEFPLGLSPEFKAGALLSDLVAFATYNDPAFGLLGSGALASEGNFDNASTPKTYRL